MAGKVRPDSRLSFLLEQADKAVLERVAELLKLEDRERLALLIARELNPLHIFTEEQEAVMRGKTTKTIRSMKQNHELPQIP